MNEHADQHVVDATLDGYARHDHGTLITYRDGETYGVLHLSDHDALHGVPAELIAAGSYDEVNAAVAALGVDPLAAAEEDRPDGTSFIAAERVMYMLAHIGDARYGLLELTDHDHLEGELAQLVFTTDDLADARGAFAFAVENRRAGRPPIAGRP